MLKAPYRADWHHFSINAAKPKKEMRQRRKVCSFRFAVLRLMTNNPCKRIGLEGYGLEIVENVPIEVPPTPYNRFYMHTKKERMGHDLHQVD